jgi:hypothetical protein
MFRLPGPQFIIVFRRLSQGDPDVVARQVDVFPAQRREMRQEMLGDIFRLPQGCDRSFEVSGVPQDDRGDDEIQARSSVLLVLGLGYRSGWSSRTSPSPHRS